MESGWQAFADESCVRHGFRFITYRMCAVVIDSSSLANARELIKPMLLPGQMKFHWKAERQSRREEFIKLMADVHFFAYVVSHVDLARQHDERFRRKCLEVLYDLIQRDGVTSVVLESRTVNQNRRDLEHIVALQNRGHASGIQIQHSRGGDEPILWMADALLGATKVANSSNHVINRELTQMPIMNVMTPTSLIESERP